MMTTPCWGNCVVPIAMKRVTLQVDDRHLRGGDRHTVGILPAIDLRSNAEARPIARGGNQTDDGGETHQRLPAPVHRDMREEAMFYLVPLARPWWEVTDGDGEPGPIREPLQFPLPEADARPVAAAGVCRNHQRSRAGIDVATHVLPPPANRVDRKARGVVVDPDADPAFVAAQIVHAVGNRLPVPGIANDEVMHANAVRLALSSPCATGILEIADQFLFLGGDRNSRQTTAMCALDGLGDISKLRGPIGMLTAFSRLDVALERVAQLVQQVGDDGMADGVAEGLQRDGQRPGTLAGPPQRRVRIAGRGGLDQRIEVAQQRRVEDGGRFPSAPGPATASGRQSRLAIDLAYTALNGRPRNPRRPFHQPDAAVPERARFGRCPQPTRPLGEHRRQRGMFRAERGQPHASRYHAPSELYKSD